MFNQMKNFLFYFPLNLLFFIGKLQGLIVFAYETVPEITYTISPFLRTYSSLYTVLIVIVLHILVIRLLSWLQYFLSFSKVVLIAVFIAESLITAYRVITVYVMQFYNRKHFRNIVAEAAKIHRNLIELMDGGALIFDKNFYRSYVPKVMGVLFQLAIVFFLISRYKGTSSLVYSDLITFSIVIYMHFTTITISSIFYAGMMLILLFYQNLNQKALQISNSIKATQDMELKIEMKHRLYCQLSDEIDRIVFIYEKISTFMKKFNQLFSSQLLLTIANAFYIVLVQVVLYC